MKHILESLLATFLDLAGSKKAVMALTTALSYVVLRVAGHYHVAIEPDAAREIAGQLALLGMVAVGGQAVADHGKEAAQVTADASLAATQTKVEAMPTGGVVVTEKKGGAP